ncbi:MAG: CheR family methyltransferase [Acidobacteriota bacterium]
MGIALQQFEYLRKLVRDHSAIVIDHDKQYLAESRLASIAVETACSSVDDLLVRLRSEPFQAMHGKVLEAMTNNETWFFRDLGPFQALEKQIIPQLLERRARQRKLRFWSAAASSGQEPYSIAMLLHSHFALPSWTYEIHATDISSAILERARLGRYSQMEINRGLPAALLARYFHQHGLHWLIDAGIKQAVTFQLLNLSQPWPAMEAYDVIFLRNVLIYFDLETRRKILAKIRRVLQPDGFLILGCAESMLSLDASYERLTFGTTTYYRPKGKVQSHD